VGPFAITPAQRRLRDVAREFAERVVAPAAADLDRRADPRECFSAAIVEEACFDLPLLGSGYGVDDIMADAQMAAAISAALDKFALLV